MHHVSATAQQGWPDGATLTLDLTTEVVFIVHGELEVHLGLEEQLATSQQALSCG